MSLHGTMDSKGTPALYISIKVIQLIGSCEKPKKRQTRGYKNYHGVADSAHIKQTKYVLEIWTKCQRNTPSGPDQKQQAEVISGHDGYRQD